MKKEKINQLRESILPRKMFAFQFSSLWFYEVQNDFLITFHLIKFNTERSFLRVYVLR